VNDGWEVGIRSTLSHRLVARVGMWQQLASREVRTKPDASGDSENIGKTSRYGVDLEVRLTPVSWLALWAGLSPVVAKQTNPGSSASDLTRKDKTLDHVPWFSSQGGIDFTKYDDLLLSLWYYAQGDYYLTKENDSPQVGDYIVVNLDGRYRVNPWLSLGLSIQNLLNSRYNNTAWYKDYGQVGALFGPAAPLSAYAFATLTL